MQAKLWGHMHLLCDSPRHHGKEAEYCFWERLVGYVVLQEEDFILCVSVANLTQKAHKVTLKETRQCNEAVLKEGKAQAFSDINSANQYNPIQDTADNNPQALKNSLTNWHHLHPFFAK